ncbi:DUF3298 domain-containing protein [Treponema sp. HNW]|uniref:DUF3298 and DUF4163 domain-containing protein n=1 Tax=Treponema sp. HNW TaxID=3116654 RepID=UPI003D120FAF
MKKTQHFIMIVSALMLCCIFLFSACVSTPAKTDKAEAQKKDGVLKIDVLREKKQTERYEYSAELPRFPDYPGLTAVVQNLHDKRFADFDRESAANFKTSAKGSHSFIMNWEAADLTDSIISIKIHTYEFIGGANGIDSIDVINWLPAKNKRIMTADLPAYFGLKYGQKEWLETLSRNTRDILENKLNRAKDASVSKFIKEGTEPTAENFKNITVSGNNITVWFEKYQAAPGSAGILSASINIKDLR